LGRTEVVKLLKDHIAKEKKQKKIKESLNERFTEYKDPLAELGIGRIQEIKEWMKSIGEEFKDVNQAFSVCLFHEKRDFVEYFIDVINIKIPYSVDEALYKMQEIKTFIKSKFIGKIKNIDHALIICAKYGKKEFVEYLLNIGADVHTDNDHALRYASYWGYTEIVKLLLDHGADVHTDNNYALRIASYFGHTEIVKLLQDHIAKEKNQVKESLNEKFTEYKDPLAELGIGKIQEIKDWMKSIGEEFENVNQAFHVCLIYGKRDFVEYLINIVDIEIPYSVDEVLYKMQEIKTFIKTTKIEKIKNINQALIICVYHKKTDFIKYLLDIGADVHTKDDEALCHASEYGYIKIVKLLLDAGADVHAQKDYALRWASYWGYTKIVKLLLDAGADVHANDNESLCDASENGHIEVVKLLLDHGANIHAKNDEALRLARENRHIKVIKLLQDYIAKEKKEIGKN